jgi:hypothetical protein
MNDEVEFGLVMPFLVCQSKGGPYDDAAYVAGYEAGTLDMALALSPPLPGSRLNEGVPYHADNMPQIDLIAMRHNVTIETEDVGDGWVSVTFVGGKDE